MTFNKNGIRYSNFKFEKNDISTLREHWKAQTLKTQNFPKRYSGKGIVFTAGGIKYTTCAWVSISLLRDIGCDLPIELWYLGNEISKEIIKKFENLHVVFRNFKKFGKTDLRGYMLKPLAIINSSFKEVLFLDADNICVKNPEYLFSLDSYKEFGSIFWPDYFRTSKSNSIWSIIGTKAYDMPEQESGQILINKEKCWQELQLCLYFNHFSRYYYKILHGDKDTFKFAWLALKSKFHMIEYYPGSCGYKCNGRFYGNTFVQHDPFGEVLFLHRNLLKWDITKPGEIGWEYIKKFNNSAQKEIHIRPSPRGVVGVDLIGDVSEIEFNAVFGNLEARCLHFLQQWRDSESYKDFVYYLHLAQNRYGMYTDFDAY